MLDTHATAALAAAAKERRAEARKLTKSREGLKKQVKAKHKAIAKAESGIDDIHRWGSDGFIDLEPALVTALQKAGLKWGGEWAGSKDFMHFEVK
jgi:putative intracellular protease/amidase